MQNDYPDVDDLPEPEPCPASFDYLARMLVAWPKVPTMALWDSQGPAPERPWTGSRQRVEQWGKLAEALTADTGAPEALRVVGLTAPRSASYNVQRYAPVRFAGSHERMPP